MLIIRYIACFILLFFSWESSSQDQEIATVDSLLSVWNNSSVADTPRLIAIHDAIVILTRTEAVTVPQLCQDLLDHSVVLNNRLYQGIAFGLMGGYYYQKGSSSHVKAYQYYQKAEIIFKELNQKERLASLYWHYAQTSSTIGEHLKAAKLRKFAIDYYKESKDTNNVSGLLQNLGQQYYIAKDYKRALVAFYESCFVYVPSNGVNYIAVANYLYTLIELDSTEHALNLTKEFILKLQTDSSGSWSDESTEYGFYHILGNINLKLSKPDSAIYYYSLSFRHRERYSDEINIKIGKAYLIQKKYHQSIQFCQKGIETTRKSLKKDAANCMYVAYTYLGKSDQAIEYLSMYSKLEDELNKSKYENNRSEMLIQHRFREQLIRDSIKNNKELELLSFDYNNQISSMNQWLKLLLALFLSCASAVIILYIRSFYLRKAKNVAEQKKQLTEKILLNTMPKSIVKEIIETGLVKPKEYELATILFTDFVGFTRKIESQKADTLINVLSFYFDYFDEVCKKYKIEKIKTIGDSYMAVGGVPISTEGSVTKTIQAAIEMKEFVVESYINSKIVAPLKMRIGIHTGSVIGGVVGKNKLQFDIWGDAVNVASRLESTGKDGKVNISKSTYDLIKHSSEFKFEYRGFLDTKGKGEIEMYFVELNK